MQNYKQGKAADIFGHSVEHLPFGLSFLSIILSTFLKLIWLTDLNPGGFKYDYIVTFWKSKDRHSKAITCNDFTGIAISPAVNF